MIELCGAMEGGWEKELPSMRPMLFLLIFFFFTAYQMRYIKCQSFVFNTPIFFFIIIPYHSFCAIFAFGIVDIFFLNLKPDIR